MQKQTIGGKLLSEIMTKGVIVASPSTPASQALGFLKKNRISCIPIVENNRPVGIFTERKIIQLAARKDLERASHTLGELMTSPVLTAEKTMDIYSAYNLLSSHSIRHLIVVDEAGKLCGVVTQSNIMDHLGYEYFIEFKRITQIMTRRPHTIFEDCSLQRALTELDKISASCLIVIRGTHPIGILTERDLIRLLIDHADLAALKVQEVMSGPVQTTLEDIPLLDAARIMKHKKIRRIVVVDKEDNLTGLITQSDIIKGLQGQYLQNLKQLVVEKDRKLADTSRKLAEKTVYLDNILRSALNIGIVATGLDFHIVYFNPAAEQILGLSAFEIIGRDLRGIHKKHHIKAVQFEHVVDLLKRQERHEFNFVWHNNGRKLYIRSVVSGIWSQDRHLVGFVLMLQDVTEQTLAEEQIKKQKADLELINLELSVLYTVSSKISRTIEMSSLLAEVLDVIISISIFDFAYRGGIFTIKNNQLHLVSHLGLSEDCVRSLHCININKGFCGRAAKTGEIVVVFDPEQVADGLPLCGEAAGYGVVAIPLKSKGTVAGILFLYVPQDSQTFDDRKKALLAAIGSQVGIALENARLYEQTKFLSYYDPLTKVANRRLMDTGLAKYFSAARRYGTHFSVIMLDIDNFKNYNDSHGHSAGDQLLVRLAEILLAEIRDADTVVRYGGEEFLIMLPETSLQAAVNSARRLRCKVEAELDATISLGVAACERDMQKKEDLIAKADEAMYRAKTDGKNRVSW